MAQAGQALAGRAQHAGRRAATSQAGEVAFLLEPDLKEGRGGLRDVHAIRWAELAQAVMLQGDDASLAANHDVLFAARVELHRRTGRPGDRLLLEEQDGVADGARLRRRRRPDGGAVSAAARAIAWTSDEVWERVDSSLKGPLGWRMSRDRELGPGRRPARRPGVHSPPTPTRPADPLLVLRVAVGRRPGRRPHRPDLARPPGRRVARSGRSRGRQETRGLFADAAARRPPGHRRDRDARPAGPVGAHPARVGAGAQPSPSATPTTASPSTGTCARRRPTRPRLVDRVDRPDLLVVGALLHDIGKGYPGDHIDVGIERRRRRSATRMGFPPDDIGQLQRAWCRHHLLLPDVATRRDLSDDGTIALGRRRRSASLAHAAAARRPHRGRLLATGPAAWSEWKAELVGELVDAHRARARRRRGRGGHRRRLPHRRAARPHGRGPPHHRGRRRPARR